LTTKIEVIESHIVASLQLIAVEANPVSTHVIVMACEDMVTGMAKARGVLLDWDYRIYVRDEFHKAWRDKFREAYNFFKHAAKDPANIFDRIPPAHLAELNEIQTVLNINGYYRLGGKRKSPFPETLFLLAAKHVGLIKPEFLKGNPAPRRAVEQLTAMPHQVIPALRQVLYERSLLPSVPPIPR
jgi:hypothetical protein